MIQVKKPMPEPSPWSKQYWDYCKQHKLYIQQCTNCEQYIMYPKLFCPHCLSENLNWVESSGKGKIYSFTIVHSNPPSAFMEELPYVIAVVELEESVRLLTNIVESNFEEIRCGAPVSVVFEVVTEEITLPKFTLSKD
jgi:uncharacterized protein